jgi:hypothetical protein
LLTDLINQTKYRYSDVIEAEELIFELLTKHGIVHSEMELLRPQGYAGDLPGKETYRISVPYDEDKGDEIWTKALTEISMALGDRNFDLAVEFIDKSKFPPLYSCGLEEEFGMTAPEWDSLTDAAVKFLTKKELVWSSMFAMRVGTSPVRANNPATLIITTPNPNLIRAIIPRLLQEIDSEWIAAIYPSLCLRPWTTIDAESSYRHDQFDDHPNIGLGYSVGVRGDAKASATLGGTLELVYEDGKRIRVGLTNFHTVRNIVKNTKGKPTSQHSSSSQPFSSAQNNSNIF